MVWPAAAGQGHSGTGQGVGLAWERHSVEAWQPESASLPTPETGWGPRRLVSPYSREGCCASQLARVWTSWVSGSFMPDLIPDSGLALDTFIVASRSVVGEEAPSKFLGLLSGFLSLNLTFLSPSPY